MLGRVPLVTVIAVCTLTFGIGLNTSMFGFMNALLFRPLPFSEPASPVRVFRTTEGTQHGGLSSADSSSATRRSLGALPGGQIRHWQRYTRAWSGTVHARTRDPIR